MTNIDAAQYVAEWASKTGKNPSEIYVPRALRDPEPERPSADEAPPSVLFTRKGGKNYRLTLADVEAPFPGQVSGTVKSIEEVPSA